MQTRVLALIALASAGIGLFPLPQSLHARALCPWCGPVAAMSTPRSSHSATRLPDGDVLIVGGTSANGQYLASAELYHPRTHSFTKVADMPSPRGGHSATLLRTGKVLIAGGYGGSRETLESSRECRGDDRAARPPHGGPSPRRPRADGGR
jgi:hypothetical protein